MNSWLFPPAFGSASAKICSGAILRGLHESVARRSCSGRVADSVLSGAMSPRVQKLGVHVVGWHGGDIVTGIGAGHVVVVTVPVPGLGLVLVLVLVLASDLEAFTGCGLPDIVVQPYGIPISAAPSTVVIAHAVRLIVFPSCGIPGRAVMHRLSHGRIRNISTTSLRSIEAPARSATRLPWHCRHRR
jgi:hypothetical protein